MRQINLPLTPKPCPFCASDDVRLNTQRVETSPEHNHIEYTYQCFNCGAYGPFDLGKSGALKQWNMRRKDFPKDEN